MAYIYKMVQIPPDIIVKKKGKTGSEAAGYLESVVNEMADQGWEFHRVDPIGVAVKPGCFAKLIGREIMYVTYYVISFRKPK